jgi:hypothetical protein
MVPSFAYDNLAHGHYSNKHADEEYGDVYLFVVEGEYFCDD